MLDSRIVVSPAPHVGGGLTTQKAMQRVLIALAPAALVAVWSFGFKALNLIVISILTAVLTEFAIQKALRKPITIMDGSAALTGLLLALSVTPELPWWMMLIGAVVSVGLAKQIFGGLGYNPFNPALIGRAFLMAAWPKAMTTWSWPENSLGWAGTKADIVSGATALNLDKMGILDKFDLHIPFSSMFLGNISGSLGETSAVLLLFGGIYLLVAKVIDWRIPVSYLAAVVVLSLVFQKHPLFQLLAGGLFLGAFFMATDWVTTPVTPKGRIYFGIGCGVITMLIRTFGGYPEGVCYSILLMNAVTPLLDRLTIPKRFGEVRTRA